MHRAMATRGLARTLIFAESAGPVNSLPLFLCPALARYSASSFTVARPAARAKPSAGAARPAICQTRASHTVTSASADGADVATPLFQHGNESTTAPDSASSNPEAEAADSTANSLPISCAGCGAFAQTEDSKQLGYYNLDSKRIRQWLKGPPSKAAKPAAPAQENEIIDQVLGSMDEAKLKELGLDPELLKGPEQPVEEETPESAPALKEPVCERCHLLLHERGSEAAYSVQMHHPTVESIRETIEESPHKHNHIYHIIDAADFPMSLIPRLNVLLGDIPLRSRNRRSRNAKYMHDRKMELSFIITRADLLGPTKETVDKMMPYLREVLRDALGRLGGRVRLGNMRCVSAKRDWWTKELKQDIWKRGGAGWMVGKVNVGKSRLFESVFPKGRVRRDLKGDASNRADSSKEETVLDEEDVDDSQDFGELLPPPRPLEMYPEMPIVSSLPGTTASPIRVPFGNNKGELIDLPGLARSSLEEHVKAQYRDDLLMKTRIVPEQVSLQSGRSLILGGGLIRITPKTPGLTFLTYNFTPLDEHVTATDKAVEFQAQTREAPQIVENIALAETAKVQKLAGAFKLRYDVTKKRAGPVAMRHRGNVPVEKLPFRVLSTDILIEGLGYVEVVAQVRTRDFEEMVAADMARELEAEMAQEEDSPSPRALEWKPAHGKDEIPPARAARSEEARSDPFERLTENRVDNSPGARARQEEEERLKERKEKLARLKTRTFMEWPTVEVFTPNGQFVDYRQPINGWLNNKPLVKPEHKRSRPRKSMKGAKKQDKVNRRAVAAAE